MTPYGVFEIRNYRVDPDRRGEFIDHFERHLIHPQEALGIAVLGQFKPVGEADRFVWIRAFRDMAARGDALADFYEASEAWKRHGPRANEIMREWDDVYLVRPASNSPRVTAGYGHGFSSGPPARPNRHAMLAIVVWTDGDDAADARGIRAQELSRHVQTLGGVELDRFLSEPAANDFPRLPVKQEKGTVISLATIPPDRCSEARESLGVLVGPSGRVWLLKPTTKSFLP